MLALIDVFDMCVFLWCLSVFAYFCFSFPMHTGGANNASTSSDARVLTVIQVVTVTETATASVTACVGSSPESIAFTSDSALRAVWVSVSLFFLVLAVTAVALAIVLARILHKKNKYTSVSNAYSTPVQFKSVGM